MRMIYLAKTVGSILGSRKPAEVLRHEVEQASDSVMFDFLDIEIMSHSFADELFGKLALNLGISDFKKRVQFKNVSENDKTLIKAVVFNRVAQKAS